MTKRVKLTKARARRIRSTSRTATKVDPALVAFALGAENIEAYVAGPLGSPALGDLRRRLFLGLKSSGGRPGLEGAERRQKIPMSDDDWERLQEIASSLASEAATPTAGQVASQLLHDAIEGFAPSQLSEPRVSRVSEPARAPYVRGRAQRDSLGELEPAGTSSDRAATPDERARSARIECAAREFAAVVLENTTACADRSTALHLIRAASMMTHAALTRGRS